MHGFHLPIGPTYANPHLDGATTLSIATFSITTLGMTFSKKVTLSIATFSITTLSMTFSKKNDTQHNSSVVMLSLIMLNVSNNLFILSVVMLNVVAPG